MKRSKIKIREPKKYTLRFNIKNKDTFLLIQKGVKTVETRAATERYKDITSGDILILVCGKEKIEKKIKKSEHFKTITALLKRHSLKKIDPLVKDLKEAKKNWYSYPGYEEKIKTFGLMAFVL